MHIGKPCPKCGGPKDRQGQSYCRACHSAYLRQRRGSRFEIRHCMICGIDVTGGRGRPKKVCGTVCRAKWSVKRRKSKYHTDEAYRKWKLENNRKWRKRNPRSGRKSYRSPDKHRVYMQYWRRKNCERLNLHRRHKTKEDAAIVRAAVQAGLIESPYRGLKHQSTKRHQMVRSIARAMRDLVLENGQ